MKKVRIDYFFELFEKSVIPKIFSRVECFEKEESIVNPDYKDDFDNASNTIYSVFFIPNYLKPIFGKDTFKIKKITQFFKGYAIFLEGFVSANAYIKYRFRSNAKGIRRKINRLESCFNISYKTYYGEIKQEEYNFLMNTLEEMLVKRFEQRNDVSQSLLSWDHYKNIYFSLINEKRASMFVVYDRNKPIVVSLNHHFYKRLFSAISSYDIDYSKFSLGSLEIYKKLDWCITNDYKSYEMGMGDLTYKREWSNHIYNFEHQIMYPKNNSIATLYANLEYMKAFAKEMIFKIAYVRYKEYKTKRKKNDNTIDVKYEAFPIEKVHYSKEHPVVDFNNDDYVFLRNIVFDFLYSSIENVSDVKVLEVSEKQKTYIIAGKSKMQKIVFM
ncbi:GNAT family N-acetyltransferase [Aquimarina muelleri]|uniref:BioF2-like acetyltransferase domain-containing protein n=1 Tax=Aquimarina muelleri TaxID=279356 RepID=A0A918JY82_9FLAO|nr:GNAT family N-acetyltransferase [Aquimarina muelleri]MCX2762874.1 GNAT family N-acetyltransferase [Aquimarina muelleri]GGX27005.1 hypothetical protein GCM10007384_30260 [Aquimarina muelleri]